MTIAPLQIVAAAMIFGTVLFAVVAVFVYGDGPPGDPILSYIAMGFTLVELATAKVVTSFIASKARGQLPRRAGNSQQRESVEHRHSLFAAYRTKTIIGYALLEGAAFLNVAAYLTEGHWWSLLLIGGLLGMMALSFPTASDAEQWVRSQHERMQFE